MKLIIASAAAIVGISSFYLIVRNNPDEKGIFSPLEYDGYKLVFAEEFTEKRIDTNTWRLIEGNGCPELCGWGNNELQYYTNDKENVFVKNGNLHIKATKASASENIYKSARITSADKAWKFGRIDIRARLPKGKGIWPAIWMMPKENKFGGWPKSGEIDIMEMVGHLPNELNGTVHFGDYWPQNKQKNQKYKLSNGELSDKYHVFSLFWEKDEIKWLIDGVEYAKVTPEDLEPHQYPFNEEFYLIINLAVGGNWPGNPDEETAFPQELIIDYVRVFQKYNSI